MHKKIDKKQADKLFEAILSLKDIKECEVFFNDLYTKNELNAIVQRFSVALLLHQNATYNDIAKKTGASTATISRVNRALQYGEKGYELVIERLKE